MTAMNGMVDHVNFFSMTTNPDRRKNPTTTACNQGCGVGDKNIRSFQNFRLDSLT